MALAGDFYANWNFFTLGCDEQVSDHYDTDPERSIRLFKEIAGSLTYDVDDYLENVLKLTIWENFLVMAARVLGEDPAQVIVIST